MDCWWKTLLCILVLNLINSNTGHGLHTDSVCSVNKCSEYITVNLFSNCVFPIVSGQYISAEPAFQCVGNVARVCALLATPWLRILCHLCVFVWTCRCKCVFLLNVCEDVELQVCESFICVISKSRSAQTDSPALQARLQ